MGLDLGPARSAVRRYDAAHLGSGFTCSGAGNNTGPPAMHGGPLAVIAAGLGDDTKGGQSMSTTFTQGPLRRAFADPRRCARSTAVTVRVIASL